MGGKKRRDAADVDASSVDPRRKDPFNATPVMPPDVEVRRDSASLAQLRREIPPKTRVGAFLAEKFGWRRYARVNLDERGTAFLEQIDGKRDLHEIERHLREQYGLRREESEQAVIGFTKALMLRGLVSLRLPGQQMPEGEHTDE